MSQSMPNAYDFGKIESQMTDINRLEIPRWNHFSLQAAFVKVHGFADAPKNAYGATVYLRVKEGRSQSFYSLLEANQSP